MIDERLAKLRTQYRESPNLRAVITTALRQFAEVAELIEDLPNRFDIESAVGDQLTILGRQMGFLRCHCVCEIAPVFGFVECEAESGLRTVGFCDEGSFIDCFNTGESTLCLNDDDVYRRHLKARRYQMIQHFDFPSLTAAIRHIWGDAAFVIGSFPGRVSISTGRDLTTQELAALRVSLRALPIAPGMQIAVRTDGAKIFGFGDGWAGFCEGAVWPDCADIIDPYGC